MSTIRVCRRQLALALAMGLIAASASMAQSLDPDKPAPLAPGVNKGNVDSMTGSHFYYFWAGPGHFDIKLAFKDLGLLGNPLRQALTFDFYADDSRLMAHNAIVAAGRLERIATNGDLADRRRIRIAVVPQKGLIRLGGYYEIEVTGEVELLGKEGATANVAPVDSSLVKKDGTTLVRPGQPLLNNDGTTLVRPGQPLLKQRP
jgi:hypothetical protein